MNIYNQLEDAHKLFIEHAYQDIHFYLKDKKGKTYKEVLDHFKQKYIFYDFEEDKFNLIENVQNVLANKIVNSAMIYYNYDKNYNKNNLRNIIKSGFYPFMNNESIFTFDVACKIDKKLYNFDGKFWYDAYDDLNINYTITEIGLFTCNIR